MRDALRAHAPAVSGFSAMVAVAVVLSLTIQAGVVAPASPVPVVPAPPALQVPGPGEDADGDSFHDLVDRTVGDAHVRLELRSLTVPDDALPYVEVGTQDDHWRLGAGEELEWPHVVDTDPLGHKAGSPSWQNAVLRTGAWWTSQPMDGASKALSEGGLPDPSDPGAVPPGVHWPQSFWVNVRDDRATVEVEVRLLDADPDPDARLGTWTVAVDVDGNRTRVGDGPWLATNATLVAAGPDGVRLTLRATVETTPEPAVQREVAERWAPVLRFDDGERFHPVSGDLLQAYHGFGRRGPADRDYQTWTREFNNGRDPYILLLADFDGDRNTDHTDAGLMYDVLRLDPRGTPHVYASFHAATNDRVAVTYWFLSMYNFVRDVNGNDIELLAHNGDREFVSLLFEDLDAARNGTPEAISYSIHYGGIRVPEPSGAPGGPLENGTHPDVYVARGSHASYPVPGDDRKFRPAFVGFGDKFDGLGTVMAPGDYELEVLAGQEWHQGYLWGPVTRHSRDLGTTSQPLLQHSFRYPYIDPLSWHLSLREMDAGELRDAFRSPS